MSSEVSGEDHHGDHQNEDTAGTKRSYDCTFCKRGFTNAQALGGHMNIHRKDRAKGKQEQTPNPFSSIQGKFTNYEQSYSSMTLPFTSEFQNKPLSHYSIREPQRNRDMYFHPPPTQLAPLHLCEFQNKKSDQPMHFNQGFWGADLSLQTGSNHVGHNASQVRRGNQKDSEVDLELRLGHDPY